MDDPNGLEQTDSTNHQISTNRYVVTSQTKTKIPLPSLEQQLGCNGRLKSIVSLQPDREFNYTVSVRTSDAPRCIKDGEFLHNLYVDGAKIPVDYMEINEVEKEIAVDNPELPSLMHLNDDCILHILQYLPKDYLLGNVCMRMRRLCKSKEKINHYEGDRLIDLFHYGPLFSHVTVKDTSICEFDFCDLINRRCVNLKFLRLNFSKNLQYCAYRIITLAQFLRVPSSLKELALDDIEFRAVIEGNGPLIHANVIGGFLKTVKDVQKLRLTFMPNFPARDIDLHSIFMQMKSLTVLIVPRISIEIGKILIEFPNLRVLACGLVLSEEYPTNHDLRDFYGFFPSWDAHVCKSFLRRLSKACPRLKNLRLRARHSDCKNIMNMFPMLEGLYLEGVYINDVHTFELPGGDNLKTFMFDCDYQGTVDFSTVFTEFSKLEVLYWNEPLLGDFFDQWKLRSNNRPLTVLSGETLKEIETREKYPDVKWVNDVTEVFGPFSIFSVPSVISVVDE